MRGDESPAVLHALLLNPWGPGPASQAPATSAWGGWGERAGGGGRVRKSGLFLFYFVWILIFVFLASSRVPSTDWMLNKLLTK